MLVENYSNSSQGAPWWASLQFLVLRINEAVARFVSITRRCVVVCVKTYEHSRVDMTAVTSREIEILGRASQRPFQSESIFRLLLKVAVKGARNCGFTIFSPGFSLTELLAHVGLH